VPRSGNKEVARCQTSGSAINVIRALKTRKMLFAHLTMRRYQIRSLPDVSRLATFVLPLRGKPRGGHRTPLFMRQEG
jgi:hypothetical protein